MTSTSHSITIRRASTGDEAVLARLASLDSTRPLSGDVLVAEVAAEAWAAIDLVSGRVIADPFRPTADLVELLQLRSVRLRGARRRGRRGLGGLRLRSAEQPARP
jgi:hypothetical protein